MIAFNASGNSAPSNISEMTTQRLTPPAAPSSLGAVAQSATRVDLVWADNSSNEEGFIVERCLGASCADFAEIARLGANVKMFSNTDVAANTTYRYRVRAWNAAAMSAYSNIVKIKTPAK
ncbi:MAG TPA: fibronectin type III domain-containing protein [Thermoanaerobaculia bacterium]